MDKIRTISSTTHECMDPNIIIPKIIERLSSVNQYEKQIDSYLEEIGADSNGQSSYTI